MEPRTASGAKRLQTIEALAKAGIPVGIMNAPVITVRVTRNANGCCLPVRMKDKLFDQPRCIFLDDDLRFKIKPGIKAPVFMGVARVTIDASMLTALIRIC